MSTIPQRTDRGSEQHAFDPKPSDAAQSDLLAQYGITSVATTTYEWGGYRYTNAHDAIAAARRGGSL